MGERPGQRGSGHCSGQWELQGRLPPCSRAGLQEEGQEDTGRGCRTQHFGSKSNKTVGGRKHLLPTGHKGVRGASNGKLR